MSYPPGCYTDDLPGCDRLSEFWDRFLDNYDGPEDEIDAAFQEFIQPEDRS
jgi:hypothetical protein